MRTLLTLILFSCLVLFSKCNTSEGEVPALARATKVIYQFRDSSVPPEYHRSHTITATKSSATLVVDSYGKIVDEATAYINEEQFNEILEKIRESRIAARELVRDEGCTGGTSESLEIFEGESVLFKADVYHCGGSDYGTLTGNIKAVKEKMKSFFPEVVTK